jgi:CRISPR-associated protein Csx16
MTIMKIENTGAVWLVSRHPGAIEWVKSQESSIDHEVTHLSVEAYPKSGDIVIGSLPVHVIAKLNEQGIRFFHIQVNIPAELRGQELTKKQLESLGGSLQEYQVSAVK